ncbi:MAG: alanine:cation symporter family protein [Leptolyngbya sp. SIO4C1]|nr:alanine:cation symporter family protein [Leptolyngbya sp. SIO4C1]
MTFAAVLSQLDSLFAYGVSLLERTLFLSIGGLPLVVLWLLFGAVFLTLRFGFINLRAFGHAIAITRGDYDDPDEPGEVSHFQSLATALSATVGLGNIAGVAIALQLGGPGAVLWMTVAGLLGMTSKFVECTLAQTYRVVQPDGTVSGGPMYYLSQGLAERGLKPLGQLLATAFAGLCALAALGGGNMFQANQSGLALVALGEQLSGLPLAGYRWVYGGLLAGLVGLVILGGIRRIAQVAARVVPTMAGVYVFAALWIVALHMGDIPAAVQTIWHAAWHPHAIEGGVVGVLVQGLRRGIFSSEAGIGSAAIAHAAAKTKEPIQAGTVAMLEPFIDTVVICNLTALVCLVSGAYQPGIATSGVALTATAFGSEIPAMEIVLALIVCLFSFSTIVSWFYYGETSWRYLFGNQGLFAYKALYIGCTFLGTVTRLGAVLTFSDMMMFAMGLPSMAGALLLSGQVAQQLKIYRQRRRTGQVPIYH